MKRTRSIRRAQAIYPYGPGAILDLGQESFVVLDTARNAHAWQDADRVRLPRLEVRGRANAPDGFRLPPLIKRDARSAALTVQRFPGWLFCPNCRRMWRWGRNEEQQMAERNQELPKCLADSCKDSILVPMRYVAACSKGHLMDVDWWRWAHSRTAGASGSCDRSNMELSFISNGTSGSSLRSLSIKCRKCGSSRNLEDLQRSDLKSIGQWCSGKQPWQKREDAEDCKSRLRVLLRSETSVHFADIDSALDLEESEADRPSEIERWLRDTHEAMLDAATSVEQLAPVVSLWVPQASSDLGREVSADEIGKALDKIFNVSDDSKGIEEDPMKAEWEKLSRPSPVGEIQAPLRVVSSGWQRAPEDGRKVFELIDSLMLVERLREVRALKGFTRVEPPGQEVSEGTGEKKERLLTPDLKRMNDPHQKRWKPAIEVFGEGLFLGFPEERLKAWEEENTAAFDVRFRTIREKLSNQENWVANRFGKLGAILPRFVMIHTFSHVLMRQLSYESGYNAASLRERLYVFPDMAGILIYTADGDSEGSLGGLVRQGKIDRAPGTIEAAIERASWCSNDPICMEMPNNGLEGLNRAACHACTLAPETSCTHLNILLDRQTIIGEGDGVSQARGYFSSLLGDL